MFIILCFLSSLSLVLTEEVILKCDDPVPSFEHSDYYCSVSNLVISHSQNVRIQETARATFIKFIRFYNSRLLYVPFKLFDSFPNLQTLDVSFTELLDVPRNTFGAASNLTALYISNNNITQISTSVFIGASSLMRLQLNNNKITSINEYSFRGLGKLNKLYLSFNRITTLHPDVFLENPFVDTVYLDYNAIEVIDPEVFNRLRYIRDINLSNNLIKVIKSNTFDTAFGLETIAISWNQLKQFHLNNKGISKQLLVDHNNITALYVNGTRIVRANYNNIRRVEIINSMYLESLELNTNNISDITNITDIANLQILDLSRNPIGQPNITTYDRMKRLRNLILQATGIRHLDFGMFSKQSSLEVLDLSYNNLSRLNLNIFEPYLKSLQKFYVDGNGLSEIEGKNSISDTFQELIEFGISRNRFNCSYLHMLLTPPQLSSSVQLHIEPDNNTEESSHIRDISCTSNIIMSKEEKAIVEEELQTLNVVKSELTETLVLMRLHELRLYFTMLFLAITLLIICIILIFGAVRLWHTKRANYFARYDGRAVFTSVTSTTENLNGI